MMRTLPALLAVSLVGALTGTAASTATSVALSVVADPPGVTTPLLWFQHGHATAQALALIVEMRGAERYGRWSRPSCITSC